MNIPTEEETPVVISPEKAKRLERYREWNTSWIGRIDSYVLHVFVAGCMGLFMFWLQRTRVHHRERLDKLSIPSVILPNHVSMLDDFFLGPPIFFWRSLFRYRWMPYHAPEEKNFFKGKFLSYLMRKLKSVPLTRGAGFTQPGVLRLIELAKDRNMLWIYAEGGRTRTGNINRGKAGVGMILYRTRAQALPIYHSGLEEVLPIGAKVPRLFRKVDIIIGNLINLDDLFALPDEPRTWQAIADRVTKKIAELRDELQELLNKDHKSSAVRNTSMETQTITETGSVETQRYLNWRQIRWQATVANYLTVARLCLVPVFVVLFLSENLKAQIIATLVFVIAAITDAVDGYIARKRNEVTTFGEFIDPFADKILTLTAFVLIALRNEFSAIFLNLFVYIALITGREIGVTMLRIWAIDTGQKVATSKWGKAKTGVQLGTLIGTLLYFNIRGVLKLKGIKVEYLNDTTVIPVLHALIILCVVVTIISGILYLQNLSFHRKEKKQDNTDKPESNETND